MIQTIAAFAIVGASVLYLLFGLSRIFALKKKSKDCCGSSQCHGC